MNSEAYIKSLSFKYTREAQKEQSKHWLAKLWNFVNSVQPV